MISQHVFDNYAIGNSIIMMSEFGDDVEGEGAVTTANKAEVKRPKKYKVLLHNDDYTTMEFVIHVLKKFFNKNTQEAEEIMLTVHTKGQAVCGIYTFEVAETKVSQVIRYAKKNGHPLKCSSEPCEGED
jgi:ATP-dependent Clp protease adaptor protein ClpS